MTDHPRLFREPYGPIARYRTWALRFGWGLAVSAVLVACSSPDYRSSVMQFGTATQAAAEAQSQRLAALNDRQVGQIRGSLAQERVLLDTSPECALLAVPGSRVADCTVIRRDGQPISEPQAFTSISALNKALADYGTALGQLAGDAGGDAAAFNASLSGLAGAVDKLGRAVGGGDATSYATELQAVAGGAGGIGNSYFAAARAAALKDIIVRMDPTVQQATQVLSASAEALSLGETTAALQQVTNTRNRLSRRIAAGADTAEIARLQSQLFADVDTLKRTAAVRDAYDAIGKSHGALAASARAGASREDLEASIRELSSLARLLADQAAAF